MKAWLLAAALFGFPAGASAAEPLRLPNASIEVERDAKTQACAEAADVARAVEERLGRPVFAVRSEAELHVRVRFEQERPRSFRALLFLSDRQGREVGQREISANARHCSALDASLALVIALLVDTPPTPVPSTPPATPDAGPPPPPPEAPVNRPTPITLPADTYAPREPWWFALTLSGVTAFGLLPGPAFGAALGFGARPPRFRQIWFSAELLPNRRLGSGPSAELSLARVGLLLCPLELGGSALQGTACVGQRVGLASAAGTGFDENQSTRQLAYDLALELSGTQQLVHPLFVKLAASAEVPLARPAYVSRSADGTRREWFQASPVAMSARLGLGLEL
jgi:hypothetical protein